MFMCMVVWKETHTPDTGQVDSQIVDIRIGRTTGIR